MSPDGEIKTAIVFFASAARRLVITLLPLIFASSSFAQTAQVKIGSLDLAIGGVQATVTPAQPTIPKNVASGVQVVVTQNGNPLTAAQVAQYLGGPFQLVGQYSGPGLTQTVDVPPAAAPNSLILDLPAVNTAGNYTLSNVRFMVNDAPVFDVTPSTIPVQVIDQVLVTSVQTTPLTLDQIEQAGVVLDASSYTGFQFTIGLAFQSQVVNVTFPVVFDPQGVPVPQPLNPPQINPPTGVNVPIPTILPILLQGTDGNGNSIPPPQLPGGGGTVRIPSVIVIPGNVGYLKQFFSAQLYVSNGAPGGSNLSVDNITGTIALPEAADGNPANAPLSLPNLTSGPQSATLDVLAPPPGGGTPSVSSLNPGDTGQADWTIRGDKEGYYTINFGINAKLNGLPTGPVTLTGSAIGGVLVRNPYFNMTFTVPGVVRKGELFNVYATVTNISQAMANDLTINFDQGALSGVTLVSKQSQPVPTLKAGDSTTLMFQFRSLKTGKAIASYLNFDTNNGTTGNLKFTLGVYANGTPMSPDTIALPSAVDNLPSDVVDAAMRVIGQAWSVATAPMLPAGVIPTSRNLVNQKALLLAEAGLRQSLGETLDSTLRDLGVDFFGGSPVDPGFDQVLRTTPAGQDFVSVLGAHLGQPMMEAGGALSYEAQLASIQASGPNFMTFAVGSGAGAAPVSVSLTNAAGNQMTSDAPGGSIVSGALFPLGASNSGPYLGLVTSPANSPYTLLLTGQANGLADISVSVPQGDGTVVRGTITGVTVSPGLRMRVVADFANPNNLVLQIDTVGNGAFATSSPMNLQFISPSGPSLISASVIGSETLSSASNYGTSAVALFDRVVDATTASRVANYTVPNNSVSSASRQLSGRLVFANLTQPEGPYVPTTLAVNGIGDQRGVTGHASSMGLQARIQNPGVVVSGRVLNPDGTPSVNAVVTYSLTKYDSACQNGAPFGVAAEHVQSNGGYQFRYVTQDPCGGGFKIATKDPINGDLRQVSNYVQTPGKQMVIDLTLLGLGSVTGTVFNLDGTTPVYNAQVTATSITDPRVGGSAYTDANGNYTINGITVGPVTVKAVKGVSVGSQPGNIQRAGTAAVVNVKLNSGSVNVSGVVTLIQGGIAQPAPGATVAYYLNGITSYALAAGVAITASDGSYSMKSVPAGSYTVIAYIGGFATLLQATQTGVSAAGDNLTIPLEVVVSSTATVTGKVTLPNGAPAPGVIVSQGYNGVLSAADGTYSLPGVPIVLSQPQTIYARTMDLSRTGQASVLISSATPPPVNITLSGQGSAQFTVRDPSGNPIAGQKITIPNGSPNCGGTSQTTDANGIAVFNNLAIGSWRAIALSSSGIDLASATATVTQDGATGFGTMQFQGSGTVTGSIIDQKQQPAFGAVVQLTSNAVDMTYCIMGQAITQSVQTGTDGKFRFRGVNVGKVGITASQTFFPTPVGEQGNLPSNGATLNFPPLQLTNSISGVLSGTIYLPDGTTPAGAGVQVTANGLLPDVTVNTDANGNFHFAKIFPEGQYKLTANDPVSGGTNQMQVYLRAGLDMTQDLRLKGTGTINVTVVNGAGVPVNSAFVTLSETDYPNASFSGPLDASNQGVLTFPNVFEGNFSVQAQDSFGRGGRTSGTLPKGISSVNVQVQLTTTGTLEGHFYKPDGVTPIPNATIQLIANGLSIGQATTLNTGEIGTYTFQYVPAGPVQLKGLDPLTGATGIAAGTITTQDQTLTLDLIAHGLDTITGTVTSIGAPKPGANVTIVSGDFKATTIADTNGTYLMAGVPEGVIVATASLANGYLSGTASETISGDQKTFTLDVALRSSGTVTGQVLMADGKTPAPPSSVSIYVGGVGGGTENTTTDSQGNFTLQNVPSGTGTISAQVLGGIDQATSQINVAEGGTTNIQINLNGTGGISGVALDSSNNPTAGTVVLQGTGAFPYYLTLTTAADGTFSVPQVLAGPFTAKLSAKIGGFTLYGTTSDAVVPYQTTKITVQPQYSGTVTASVLRPDGQTPAVGANVTISLEPTPGIQPPCYGRIVLQVQNDGTFTAEGVPLCNFSVQITDLSTNGLAAIEGQTLTTNGQIVDLHAITLDGNALSVVGSNPTDGATGIGVNQALAITFSEALSGASGIFVTNGPNNLYLVPSISSDGKTVTLQGSMPDGIPLVLNITGQVTDVFGRQLLQPQTIHFTTTDLSPPYVTSILPANGAIQVPVNSNIVVTFNKALSSTADFSNVFTVSTEAGPVAGSTALTGSNILTFTPSVPLANNTRYIVSVNGAVSFGGNVQTSPFTSTFASPETIPPVLQINSPVDGTYIKNSTPTISISLSDTLSGINPASGLLVLDGQNVTPIVGSTFMAFTPTTSLSDGVHTISASVQNYAGIVGALPSVSFTVDTTPPSVPVLSGVTEGQTFSGGSLSLSAASSDSGSGVVQINGYVDGTQSLILKAPSFQGTLALSSFSGGTHSLTAQAVDGVGNLSAASSPLHFVISAATGIVSGHVYNPDSSPATGVQVELSSNSQSWPLQTTTDWQGAYQITGVHIGSFTVSASLPAQYLAGTQSGIIPPEGQPVSVDIYLQNNALTLPLSLSDGNNYSYDPQADGSLAHGDNWIFGSWQSVDTGGFLLDIVSSGSTNRFTGNNIAGSELAGRQLDIMQSSPLADLNVTRKVYVPKDGYFVRYLELISNPGTTAATFDLKVTTNLSAQQWPDSIVASSSGAATLNVTDPNNPDRWVVIDGSYAAPNSSGEPPVTAFVFDGAGATLPVSQAQFTTPLYNTGQIVYEWDGVSIPAGATVAFLHFGVQQSSRTSAEASAARLVLLPPEALAGISPQERSEVQNFAIPSGGVSTVAPLPPLNGTVTGQLYSGDGVTPVPSQQVTLQSANAYFNRPITAYTDASGAFSFTSSLNSSQFYNVLPVDTFTLTLTNPPAALANVSVTANFPPGQSSIVQDFVLAGTGSITGTVATNSGQLVTGGQVSVSSSNYSAGTNIGTDGTYTIGGVPSGETTITASVPAALGAITGTAPATVIAGQTVTSNIVLQATGTVQGMVTSANGEPLSNILVKISVVYYGNSQQIFTDANGNYVSPNIPPGSYNISACFASYYYLWGYYCNTTIGNAQVTVTTGSVTIQNFAVAPPSLTGSVAVAVSFSNGNAASNARVQVSNGSSYSNYSWTNSSGYVTLTGIPLGPFTVEAWSPTNSQLTSQVSGTLAQDGDVASVNLVLPDGGPIAGQVRTASGLPAGGIYISAYASSGTFYASASATSDANGNYVLNGLPAETTPTINFYFAGWQLATTISNVTVGAYGTTTPLNVTLPALATVQVTVLRANNTPFANAYVYLQGTGASYTDSSGIATFANVPQGVFTVQAENPAGGYAVLGTASGTVNFSDDGKVVNVTVTAVSSVNIQGQVFAADGQTPIPYAYVQAVDPVTGTALSSAYTDANGTYHFFDVAPSTSAFQVVAQSPQNQDVSATASGTFITDGQTVTIDLTVPVSALTGNVTFYDGTPASNPSVFITQTDIQGNTTTFYPNADYNGNFSLFGMALGAFTVHVQDQNSGLSGSLDSSITNIATPIHITVPLQPSGTVTGKVLTWTGGAVPYPNVVVSSLSIPFNRFADTDGSGNYSLNKVPLGELVVSATTPVSSGNTTSGAASGKLSSAGQTLTLNVPIARMSSMTGTVFTSDQQIPVPQAYIAVENNTLGGGIADFLYDHTMCDGWCDSLSDANGNFQVAYVPVGPVRITAAASDLSSAGFVDATLSSSAPLNVRVALGNATAFPNGVYPITDPYGFLYDLTCSGSIQQGGQSTNAGLMASYSGAATLLVNNNAPAFCIGHAVAPLEQSGQQITIGPRPGGSTNALLSVGRKVYVPPTGGFVRYLDSLTNPLDVPITTKVEVDTNFSAEATPDTLLADPAVNEGTFAVVQNSASVSAPLLGFVFAGSGSTLVPDTYFAVSSSSASYVWTVTVPAHQTLTLMHFLLQWNNQDASGALSEASALVNLSDPNALTGMTAQDKQQVVNFHVQ